MEKPTPPDEIPSYVADGLARQDNQTLRQIIQHCEHLIANNEQDIDEEDLADESEELIDVDETETGAVVIKKVPCGKDNCSQCPHGPYKYIVTREGDSHNWEYKGAVESE